ncbi:hypothetical protein [Demequina rhizosphaerae]|uniref:hypothetical protein n=1 Tax=Demequina rhizosphaerae TaxID=1638985 RepID=UPI000785BD77|nr:hypothetical protein [Demequina rhizosphaerae]
MRIRPAVVAVPTVVLALALAACEPRGGDDVRDSRDPDAVGTVTRVEDAADVIAVGFAPDPGYEYFEGTTFDFAEQGGLEGPDGEALTGSDVAVGDRLEVWVEACAESFPVQCPDPVGRVLP